MDYDTPSQVSYESLICYPDNFSEQNYLGHFQFGKFYHGKIIRNGGVRHVLVKIWEVPVIYNYLSGENELRLMDELSLLCRHTLISHPGMVTLCEYCFDGEHLGVVYELKALESLYNLIPKTMITTEVVIGCYGYIDAHAAYRGIWSREQDVFAFGTILLSLISKRVYTEEERLCNAPNVNEWAWDEYNGNLDVYSLVHESLAAESDFDPADGRKITPLGIKCLHDPGGYRPTMKQVVRRLLTLNVVKRHADFLGVNIMHSPQKNGYRIKYTIV